jgi:hypothetical protein
MLFSASVSRRNGSVIPLAVRNLARDVRWGLALLGAAAVVLLAFLNLLLPALVLILVWPYVVYFAWTRIARRAQQRLPPSL